MRGIVLIVHLSYKKSCLPASFTPSSAQLLVYVMTVKRSSRSMLKKSMVVSSGSFGTAGIVSFNS